MFVDLGRGVWWILEDLTALQHRFGQIPGFHVAHAAKKNCHRERADLVIGDFPTRKTRYDLCDFFGAQFTAITLLLNQRWKVHDQNAERRIQKTEEKTYE